jgi:hypothetical protein
MSPKSSLHIISSFLRKLLQGDNKAASYPMLLTIKSIYAYFQHFANSKAQRSFARIIIAKAKMIFAVTRIKNASASYTFSDAKIVTANTAAVGAIAKAIHATDTLTAAITNLISATAVEAVARAGIAPALAC